MTGTITSLRPGGFGFLASDAYRPPWNLYFSRTAVIEDGFDRLFVGQRVRFDQVPTPGNPGHQQAVRLTPLD